MKLKLYMKSGNTIIVKGVKDWKIKHAGENITSLTITREEGTEGFGLITPSISLRQIEAMEKV